MLLNSIKVKLIKKNLSIYNFYFFAYFFALGAFFPWFPVYMKEVAELPKERIGIILSFSPLISILFQPIWGIINDKFRLDKKIVFLGIVMMNLFIILILINKDFYFVAMYALLFGLFSCGVGPIQDSLTVLYTSKYGFKYGDVRIYGSLGFALATLITGYTVKEYGYTSIIILCTLFYILALMAFMKVKQVRLPLLKKNIKRKNHLLLVLKDKRFIVFLFFSALSIGVLSAMSNYTTLRITALGGSTSQIGVVTSLTVIIEIITMIYITKINNSISDFKLLIISIIIQVPFLLVYVFFDQLNLLLYILLIRGISSGLFIPVMVNFISSLLPKEKIASGLILYSALSINLTGYITTILSGYIIVWFSYKVLFVIILILVLTSFIFAFLLYEMKKR
ncbi:MFS transporter [Mycoplasmatota bacterium]|nr:MFS transporter [Mycoplasmatota bacterium]